MKWTYLSPSNITSELFGFIPSIMKVARFNGKCDVRMFRLRGWKSIADLLDHDPRSGKTLRTSQWFVFVAR